MWASMEQVWAALPAGVQAVEGRAPHTTETPWVLNFDTGMSMMSWGNRLTVALAPGPNGQDCLIRIWDGKKFGLTDWGRGKRIAERFIAAVAQALNVPRSGSPQRT